MLSHSVCFTGRANGPLAICAICVPVFVLFSRMRIIGLTGGIASGKSEASRVLRQMGVPVIDADEIALGVMQKGKPTHSRVVSAFRKYPGVVTADGDIDRGVLRELVFSDPDLNRCLSLTLVCVQNLMLPLLEKARVGVGFRVWEGIFFKIKVLNRVQEVEKVHT